MGPPVFAIESGQYLQSRRGKSRNKVAVGEPAAGSFSDPIPSSCHQEVCDLIGGIRSGTKLASFRSKIDMFGLLLAGDPARVRGHQITLNDASLGSRIEEGRSQVR